MRLAERVALVTGAAQGLDRTFAGALAAEGADVIGLDVESQDETAEAAAAGPGAFLGVRADVTDPEAVAAAVATGIERFGRLHIVVNNEGIFPPIPFEKTSLDDLHFVDLRMSVTAPLTEIQTAAADPA